MADYHGPLTRPKAKKEHHCIYCGGPITTGEQYIQMDDALEKLEEKMYQYWGKA